MSSEEPAMRTHFKAALAAAVALFACNVGPAPKDASAPALPITSARVLDTHVIEDVSPSPAVLAVLAAPDRLARDKAEDGPRQAADFLTFLNVQPGMRIAEIESGTGYTA